MYIRPSVRGGAAPSFSISRQLHALDQFEALVLRCQYGYTCICVNNRGYSRKSALTSSKLRAFQANEKPVSRSFRHPWFSLWPFLLYSEANDVAFGRHTMSTCLLAEEDFYRSSICLLICCIISFTKPILTVTGCNYIDKHQEA